MRFLLSVVNSSRLMEKMDFRFPSNEASSPITRCKTMLRSLSTAVKSPKAEPLSLEEPESQEIKTKILAALGRNSNSVANNRASSKSFSEFESCASSESSLQIDE